MNDEGLFNVKSFRVISVSFNVELNFMKKTLLLSLLVAVGLVGCGGNSEDDKPNPTVEKGVLYQNVNYDEAKNLTQNSALLPGYDFGLLTKIQGNEFYQTLVPLEKNLEFSKKGFNNKIEIDEIAGINPQPKLVRPVTIEHGDLNGNLYLNIVDDAMDFELRKLDTTWKTGTKFVDGKNELEIEGMIIRSGKDMHPLTHVAGTFYKFNADPTGEMHFLITMYRDGGQLYLNRAMYSKEGKLIQPLDPLVSK